MPSHDSCCTGTSRRTFLSDLGMGFVGMSLGAMLHNESVVRADGAVNETSHRPPRARRVIWLMMRGGVSHLESFDPKPELNKHAGKTIAESSHEAILDSPYIK